MFILSHVHPLSVVIFDSSHLWRFGLADDARLAHAAHEGPRAALVRAPTALLRYFLFGAIHAVGVAAALTRDAARIALNAVDDFRHRATPF